MDYIGHWFNLLAKIKKADISILCGRINGDKTTKIRRYSHDRFDGVSMLVNELSGHNYYHQEIHGLKENNSITSTTPTLLHPQSILRQRPSVFILIVQFFFYTKNHFFPYRSRTTKKKIGNTNKESVLPASTLVWHVFSQQETQYILNKIKQRKHSVTPHLIATLLPALQPIWVNKKHKIKVALTVSTHTKLPTVDTPKNEFSLTHLLLDEQDKHDKIKSSIDKKLKKHYHYALWTGQHLPKILGHWIYHVFIHSVPFTQHQNVIFSNLGKWSNDERSALFFAPPVFHFSPLSVGVCTCNGQLSLTLHTHHSLQLDDSAANAMLEQWKNSL